MKYGYDGSVIVGGLETEGLESDASTNNNPITGVKSREPKKYPQNPILRFRPIKPISRDATNTKMATSIIISSDLLMD
jgi:hypothetical protein